MYIKKFQVGGVAYTPFIPQGAAQTQVAQSSSSGDGSTKSSSSKKSKLEDDIINILKENGIPSDVNAFLKVADSFLSSSQDLSNSTLFGGTDDSYSMSDLIKLQQYANDIKFNKEIYNRAVANLESENAWSDYALDANGNFYVYEDGKLGKATASEVSDVLNEKSDRKFTFLTYSQLAGLREQGIPFNADILKDLEGAVGNKTTADHFIDLISKFSKNTTGSVDTKQSAIAKGLEYIVAAGPNGYYNVTVKDQIRDINTACATVWQNLTGAEQNNIKRNIALAGGNPNSGKEIYNELANLIYRYAEYSPDAKFTKEATEYDPKLTGKTGGSSTTVESNYLQTFANGRLTPAGYRTITPHHSKISEKGSMSVMTYVGGAPIDKDNNTLGMMNLDQFRQKCWALQAGNTRDITFGDKVLNSEELSGVVYDGNSELTVAMLPTTRDPETGRMKPDFKLISKYNEIKEAIKNNPNMNDVAFAELCRSKEIDPSIFDRKTGNMKMENTTPFIVFGAIAGDDTLKFSDEEKQFLEHIDSDRGELLKDKYNNSVQYGELAINKNSKKYNSLESSGKRDLYEGNVYVPMPDSFRGMLLSGIGEYMPKEDMTDYARRVQAKDVETAYKDEVQRQHPEINGDTLGQMQ